MICFLKNILDTGKENELKIKLRSRSHLPYVDLILELCEKLFFVSMHFLFRFLFCMLACFNVKLT